VSNLRPQEASPALRASSADAGFTLIELFSGDRDNRDLASLLSLPSFRAKEGGRASVCATNLRQIGIAAHMYADGNNDMFSCLQGGSVVYGGQWNDGAGTQPPPRARWIMMRIGLLDITNTSGGQ